MSGMSDEPRVILGSMCEIIGSSRFVMNPEDDPLKAKQETLTVPPHPLDHTPTLPVFQTSWGYHKVYSN